MSAAIVGVSPRGSVTRPVVARRRPKLSATAASKSSTSSASPTPTRNSLISVCTSSSSGTRQVITASCRLPCRAASEPPAVAPAQRHCGRGRAGEADVAGSQGARLARESARRSSPPLKPRASDVRRPGTAPLSPDPSSGPSAATLRPATRTVAGSPQRPPLVAWTVTSSRADGLGKDAVPVGCPSRASRTSTSPPVSASSDGMRLECARRRQARDCPAARRCIAEPVRLRIDSEPLPGTDAAAGLQRPIPQVARRELAASEVEIQAGLGRRAADASRCRAAGP